MMATRRTKATKLIMRIYVHGNILDHWLDRRGGHKGEKKEKEERGEVEVEVEVE